MAIQTVTTENLAEFAANKGKPPESSAQADGPTPGNPVITSGEEKTPDAPPSPGPQKEAKAPKPVQPRIDELVREKKELDEAFQEEYEQRLRLEGEIAALRSQQQPVVEKPKDEIGPEPDPAKFTDQKEFLAKWGEWQRKTARAEFAAEQDRIRAEETSKRLAEEMTAKVAKATADYSDFNQVMQAADRRTRVMPNHIKAAIYESEWGAHLAYHLAKDAAEEKRIFGLPAARALLELGKIEQTFAKKPEPVPQTNGATPPPVTPQVPPPVAKLRESAGILPADLSQPMSFKDYRSARLEQIRANGRRRH